MAQVYADNYVEGYSGETTVIVVPPDTTGFAYADNYADDYAGDSVVIVIPPDPTGFVVEDGTGRSDANTYASVAYARAFASSVGIALPADDDALKVALRAAVAYVDAQPYSGQPTTQTQALEWPRRLAMYRGYPLSSNDIPDTLKKAQVIAAALNPLGLDLTITTSGGGIKREKVGPLETEYFDVGSNVSEIYSAIDYYLKPLLNYVGGYRLSPSFGF